MAPVTRSQQVLLAASGNAADPGGSSTPAIDFSSFLPSELVTQVLELLEDHADLSRVAVVNRRLSQLTTCRLWRALFVARWGPATAAQEDAALIAGSWRALFRSKHQTDAASNGWTRPCEFELEAALRRLAARAALAGAAPEPKKDDHPASPAGPLSAAASSILSPAASSASSLLNAGGSLSTSPANTSPLSSPFLAHPGGSSRGGHPHPHNHHHHYQRHSTGSTSSSLATAPAPAASSAALASPFGHPRVVPVSSPAGGPSGVHYATCVATLPLSMSPPRTFGRASTTCSEGISEGPCAMAVEEPPTPRELQLVYLLDGSGSVSEEDFGEMKRFVTSSARIISTALGAGALSKVGVIQFSTEPRVEVPLTSLAGEGATQLASALDNMVRMNGGTNIATAIARAGALMKAEDQQASEGAAGAAGAIDAEGIVGVPQVMPVPPHLPLPPPPPLPAFPHEFIEDLELDEEEGEEDLPPGVVPAAPPAAPPVPSLALPAAPTAALAGQGPAAPPASGGVRPVRLLLILTDGRVDTYQAREARSNACRLADELSGCTLAAFGVGRGVDRAELLHIIDTPQGDAASRYLDLYTRDDAPW